MIKVVDTDKTAERLNPRSKILKLAKNSKTAIKYQKNLNKESFYRIPKGYLRWQELNQLIAVNLSVYETNCYVYNDRLCVLDEANNENMGMILSLYNVAFWFIQSSPIYLINSKLLESFMQTEVQNKNELFKNIKPPLPSLLLLFPEGYLQTPKGAFVDHVFVTFSDAFLADSLQKERHGLSICKFDQKDDFQVNYSFTDTGGNFLFHGIGIKATGSIVETSATQIDPETGATVKIFENKLLESPEQGFVNKIDNIVLQVLLCLCFKPELITDVESSEIKESGKGFYPKSKNSNQPHYLTPRWLGKNYQHQTTKGDRSDREYHVSGWWRKGFWRNQPYGSRVNPSYRPTWIEPTWCQPGE